ncbi:hypothetical protein ACHQM5_002052 [Ranunculus cassubicifolius]
MFYQSGIRIQRSKGLTVKQGIQVALILAFCIWVLYQIKHSHDKKNGYGETSENLVGFRRSNIVLGRKSYAGSSYIEEAVDSALSREELNQDRNMEDVKDGTNFVSDIQSVELRSSEKEKPGEENVAYMVVESNDTESSYVQGITHFTDQNGIPQDGQELEKSLPNETVMTDKVATGIRRAKSVSSQSDKHRTGVVSKQVETKSNRFDSSNGATSLESSTKGVKGTQKKSTDIENSRMYVSHQSKKKAKRVRSI